MVQQVEVVWPAEPVHVVGGRRARPVREDASRAEGLDDRHNTVIMSVLCVIIGAKLIGDTISGLSR
jgi:hypothetical protein